MRLVVFGWGNESRGDDGLGPELLRRLGALDLPDVVAIEDYQLQIEHALDLDGADCALFIDAGRNTPAPYTFGEIAARPGMTHTTHALAPEILARRFRATPPRPPAAVVCAMRAWREFRIGRGAEQQRRRAARDGVGVCRRADARALGGGVAEG